MAGSAASSLTSGLAGLSGIFGSTPAPVQAPNPFASVASALPGTEAITNAGSNDVLQELTGQLSPQTLATIQNSGAAWGVQNGMPGSGVQRNMDLFNVGTASMNQEQQGQKQYQSLVNPSSQYLTLSPSNEANLAESNAVTGASPNPSAVGLANLGSQIAGYGWGYEMNNGGGGGDYNFGSPSEDQSNAASGDMAASSIPGDNITNSGEY